MLRMNSEMNAGMNSEMTGELDFGEVPERDKSQGYRRGLRLVVSGMMRGPEKYQMLDLRRRRAQIRARRVLDLI